MKKCLLFSAAVCASLLTYGQNDPSADSWADNGSHIETTNSGNVGIGTSSPSFSLDIFKSNAGIRFKNTYGSLQMAVATGNGSYAPDAQTGDIVLRGMGSGKKFIFHTGSTWNSGESFLFTADGGRIMQILDNGNVGIGSSTPSDRFEVQEGAMRIRHGNNSLQVAVAPSGWAYSQMANTGDVVLRALGPNGKKMIFSTGSSFNSGESFLFEASGNRLLEVFDNGKVGIGTNSIPNDYSLAVRDGIITEKLKVAVHNTTDWSDYVFADDYQLKPLEEVETFVKENKHLPGVPSAEEVVETGIDMAKMDATLLEKIEELTLYMIELKKENEALKQRVGSLESN